MNLAEDVISRLEYPLGPGCPFLKIAGAEVPQWLRAMEIYDKTKPALAKLKAACAGEVTICGEFYDEGSDLRILFCIDCQGSVGHRISAYGYLALPQTEVFLSMARTSMQMTANEIMERVSESGGTTIVINQG